MSVIALQLAELADEAMHRFLRCSPDWLCDLADLSYSGGESRNESTNRLAVWLYVRLTRNA